MFVCCVACTIFDVQCVVCVCVRCVVYLCCRGVCVCVFMCVVLGLRCVSRPPLCCVKGWCVYGVDMFGVRGAVRVDMSMCHDVWRARDV